MIWCMPVVCELAFQESPYQTKMLLGIPMVHLSQRIPRGLVNLGSALLRKGDEPSLVIQPGSKPYRVRANGCFMLS